MKKVIFILVILMMLPACTREIVLRKNQSLAAPFNEKTLPKGSYELTLYKLSYPKLLKEKQVFWTNLNVLLKKYILGDKKINLLINEEFYNDLLSLKTDALLEEERIYDKQASLLTDEEIQVLLKTSGNRIEKYKGTTQEYLNFQILYLLKFIGQEDSFDENKIYSERQKSELIDKIREIRRENLKLLDEVKIGYVLQIDNPYESNDKNSYWDNREITLKGSSNFSKTLNNYDIPIYIKGLDEKDIDSLIKEELKINNKALLLDNKNYVGYKNTGSSYIFLLGGNKVIKSYESYDFTFKIVDTDINQMLNLKTGLTINDILGGKK